MSAKPLITITYAPLLSLTGLLNVHLFVDCLVALETAKRKLRLGIPVLVSICTRGTSTLLTWRRVADNREPIKILGIIQSCV